MGRVPCPVWMTGCRSMPGRPPIDCPRTVALSGLEPVAVRMPGPHRRLNDGVTPHLGGLFPPRELPRHREIPGGDTRHRHQQRLGRQPAPIPRTESYVGPLVTSSVRPANSRGRSVPYTIDMASGCIRHPRQNLRSKRLDAITPGLPHPQPFPSPVELLNRTRQPTDAAHQPPPVL